MIAIEPSNDRYKLIWHTHIETAQDAIEWCYQNWGNDWGRCHLGVPDRLGQADHYFLFYQLSHANWFKLRFDSV